MSAFAIIVLVVGAGLLLLGTAAACALYSSSVSHKGQQDNEVQHASLWGLFILGISAGLLMIWLALPA